MCTGGLRGRARWPLLYKPRTFLSYLASELRLGSLGLCVVINGNLKQRELTISFFISLRSLPPRPLRGPRARRDSALARGASPPLIPSPLAASRQLPPSANETRVHRTRAPRLALMMNVALEPGSNAVRLFTLPSRRGEKKILETFSHRRGKLLREDLLSIAACLFYVLLSSPSKYRV